MAISDVYRTIQSFMGGLFINYFNDFAVLSGGAPSKPATYRRIWKTWQFYVRNSGGQTVPLSALTKFESRSGPELSMR